MRDDQSVDLALGVRMISDVLCKQDVRGKREMESRMMELLFSRNKDGVIHADRKGKKNTTFGEKKIHLTEFEMWQMLIADTVRNTDQCAYSVTFNGCNKMKVN